MRKELKTRIDFNDFDTQNYQDDVARYRQALREEFEELFDLNYPEALDYANLVFDRGLSLQQFVSEQYGIESADAFKEKFEKNFSDVVYIRDLPLDTQRDYRTYLKTQLIEGGYQDSVEDFSDNGTGISNYKLSCLEEFQEEIDYSLNSELVEQQRKIIQRRNMEQSLKELRQAMYAVSEAWFTYDLDATPMTGCEISDYPFDQSFDEVASQVADWVETQLNKIKEERLQCQKRIK